jgi:oxygen-dependent protoporphyrinogen oxidase
VDLLGPLFGGLYASDPRDMLVRHALLPTLLELRADRSAVLALLHRGFAPARAAPCSFRRGMRTLTDAMLAGVREHVQLETPVVAIARGTGGYRVRTDRGDHEATDVVLTCAADAAARLLGDVAPRAASALASLRYNRIAIVHLVAEGVTPGMGYQVSLAEPLLTRGVTFNHWLFGRDGVYTAFLGGAREPGLAGRADDDIARVAAEEFGHVTGRVAMPLHVARAAMPAWDRTWTALENLELPDGLHLCANYESRVGIPGRISRARQVAALIAD